MSRSSKKKPFVQEKLLKRIEKMNETGEKEVLKTWSRASTIYPQMVGHTIAVHDMILFRYSLGCAISINWGFVIWRSAGAWN